MTAAEAKKIPITAVLGKPSRIERGGAWYHSPFREERTPSFRVDLQKNVWYDHGEGAGGTIIDLVCRLENCSVSEALRIIANKAGDPSSFSFSPASSSSASSPAAPIEILKIQGVQNKALLDYLASRRIRSQLPRKYIREVYYRVAGKHYFSIGFRNDSGGWELRNKYMKGNAGGKDVTSITGADPAKRIREVSIFEGFFDFLSALEYFGRRPAGDTIVLNSLSMLDRALSHIKNGKYRQITLFLDNDPAGIEAAGRIRREFTGCQIVDGSKLYKGKKDFNGWLTTNAK